MKNTFYSVAVLIVSLFAASPAQAQKQEPFHPEWLAEDLTNIELLTQLVPLDRQTRDSLEPILGANFLEKSDRGFGAGIFTFSKPGGYARVILEAFVFNNSYIRYRIGISSSIDSWPKIRESIIAAWKRHAKLDFVEYDSGLYFQAEFPAVLAAYQLAVNSELGELRAVSVPADLKADYEYLISPYRNSVVGTGGCGYAGILPAGKESIDRIVRAQRFDLLENILRGYNPGGRVYAALALKGLAQRGRKLTTVEAELIQKIAGLDTPIETCFGCMYYSQNAGEILASRSMIDPRGGEVRPSDP